MTNSTMCRVEKRPSFPIPIPASSRRNCGCRDVAAIPTAARYRDEGKAGWTFAPVTEADRSAEVALRAAISATHPDHAILGEEYGETGSGSCRWVGTRPFICGIPVWSTLIGFTVEGRARCMGREHRKALPSCTREVSDLSQAILHTTSPEHYDGALKTDSIVSRPRSG